MIYTARTMRPDATLTNVCVCACVELSIESGRAIERERETPKKLSIVRQSRKERISNLWTATSAASANQSSTG